MSGQNARRAMRGAIAAATLLTGALAVPTGASAGAATREAALLGPTIAGSVLPHVAANTHGDVIAIWTRTVDGIERVEARFKPAGHSWGTPTLVSPAGSGAHTADVYLDAAGNATVTWVRADSALNNRVQTRRRSANGTWSAVKTLSAAGQGANDAVLAGDPKGDVIVAWDRYDGSDTLAQAVRRPAGGSWSAVKTVSPAGRSVTEPNVAMGPGGGAAVVWILNGVLTSPVQIARRPAGGPWSAPQTLTPVDELVYEPDVAIDGDGVITTIWRGYDGDDVRIEARRRTSQGWGSPAFISPDGFETDIRPHVVADKPGNVFVTWGQLEAGGPWIQVVRRPPGGGWGSAMPVSTQGLYSQEPRIAVNLSGDAGLTWMTAGTSDGPVQARRRLAGGSWTPAKTLNAAGTYGGLPDVAVAGDGTIWVIWSVTATGSYNRIQVAHRPPGDAWIPPSYLTPPGS